MNALRKERRECVELTHRFVLRTQCEFPDVQAFCLFVSHWYSPWGWHNIACQLSLNWRDFRKGVTRRYLVLTHLSWNRFSIIKHIMLLQFPILSLQLGCFFCFQHRSEWRRFHTLDQTDLQGNSERMAMSFYFFQFTWLSMFKWLNK